MPWLRHTSLTCLSSASNSASKQQQVGLHLAMWMVRQLPAVDALRQAILGRCPDGAECCQVAACASNQAILTTGAWGLSLVLAARGTRPYRKSCPVSDPETACGGQHEMRVCCALLCCAGRVSVSNYYYILGHERHTFQAPSMHAAITARLQRSMHHVREGFKRFKVGGMVNRGRQECCWTSAAVLCCAAASQPAAVLWRVWMNPAPVVRYAPTHRQLAGFACSNDRCAVTGHTTPSLGVK